MKEKIKNLKNKASQIRKLIIEMLARAKSGHPGGSLSSADIIACLYFDILKHDPKNPQWSDRDKFHLSKGHCCPALYAALALCGYFEKDELWKLRKLGALLQGHSDSKIPGVEIGSGSLGQGLGVCVGMALAARLDKKESRIYCLMGDGELQEGGIWEGAMSAAHYKLDNLCGVVDFNRFQIDGRIEEIMALEPLVDKWEAFGWHVIQSDGHNIEELLTAFNQAKTIKQKPTLILAHTVKGKGVSFMEHVVNFHGVAPTQKEKDIAIKELDDIEKLEKEKENI